MNYKEYFKGKKVAIIGVGPHGEMLADIKFLHKSNTFLTIYDMRSEDRLGDISGQIKEFGIENLHFGKIDPDHLLNFEIIIISPEISKKSFFLKKVLETSIPVEYPETLFFKLAPAITLIGVIGEYGKSTVSYLIYNILKKGFKDYEDQGLFLMDPDSSSGALAHLKKIKKGDVVLARIPETLLSYLYQIRISPYVAVVISPTYFDILEFQTYNNFIVAPDYVVDAMKTQKNFLSKAKILRTRDSLVSLEWNIPTYPIYNYENFALALQTSELFKIPSEITRQVIQEFTGLKGRMEFVKKVLGVEFYNDASSITAKSTLAALRSLYSKDQKKNIILILGGAYTGHDYSDLVKNIPEYVSAVILISGSGVIGLRGELKKIDDLKVIQAIDLEEAVKQAKDTAQKGDRVLFSPAFEAVGVDLSRKERADKYIKIVRSL